MASQNWIGSRGGRLEMDSALLVYATEFPQNYRDTGLWPMMRERLAEMLSDLGCDLEAWKAACARAKARDASGGVSVVETEYRKQLDSRVASGLALPENVEPMDDETRRLLEETVAKIRAKSA